MDEFGHGQPVEWCITTHETGIFECLFHKTEREFRRDKSTLGMSGMATQYYEAFCSVNNYYPKHLLCSWHIDKA